MAQDPFILTHGDIENAAARLGVSARQLKAVIAVESGGGWFTDLRAEILNLDGPGGFIDGSMPKILFEAHLFSEDTKGKYDKTHPNISSRKWDQTLYFGGQSEYKRLYAAAQLDNTAALRSASWGMFQILGRNFKAAGFQDVQSFVAGQKASAAMQLAAFCNFVANIKLVPAIRQMTVDPESCRAFAKGYNGKGYAKNAYHEKLAKALR